MTVTTSETSGTLTRLSEEIITECSKIGGERTGKKYK